VTSNNKNKSDKGDKKNLYIISFRHCSDNNIVFSEAALCSAFFRTKSEAFCMMVQEVIARLSSLFPSADLDELESAAVSIDKESLSAAIVCGDYRLEYNIRELEEAHE